MLHAAPTLPDPLELRPFQGPVMGEVLLPGSKSLTNRALLLAALCRTKVELTGALFSEDTRLMIAALQTLGLQITNDEARGTVVVENQEHAFRAGTTELFVGLAGTAARFLTALCAAAPLGTYRIDGVPQMRRRPMKGLIDALRSLGADITCLGEEGHFPLEIRARGLRGGAVSLDATESSQMLSALLMVAPLADQPVEVTLVGGVRWPFVQMTTRLMEHFGQEPFRKLAADRFLLPSGKPYSINGYSYAVEPDATAASYFLALPRVVGGRLRLPGLRGPGEGLQGDTRFMEVMKASGVDITLEGGVLTCSRNSEAASPGSDRDFSEFSDTFLTLAAIAPLFSTQTRISGIAHTRKQETDRISGMANELRRLGQGVVETEDSLEITPRPLTSGQLVETYNDHRFAMSFGILGCLDLHGDGTPWLSLRNPACCAKTFPNFFEVLESLRPGGRS